jgi:hypothetical protein
MSEGFLSRWSRRKDESRRAPERADAAQTPPPGDAALTPEEIAALPKIDELTAASDITVFLRRGVPGSLRNAALRAAWLADPAIRDFVGHARDYSYDWNTPGGAPGHGALDASDDIVAMVRRILGDPTADKPASPIPADGTADASAGDLPTKTKT